MIFSRLIVMVVMLIAPTYRYVFAAENATASNSASTASASTAASASAAKKEKKDKKQTLNFEDELVEGATTKPELFFLFQKKNFNYNKLIRLRENFIPEMKKTSEELQRSRREN